MYEAMWAYWAVFIVVAQRDGFALAYGLAYVSAATTVTVNLSSEPE